MQFEVVKVHCFRSLTTMFGMQAALIVEREVGSPMVLSNLWRQYVLRKTKMRRHKSAGNAALRRILFLLMAPRASVCRKVVPC